MHVPPPYSTTVDLARNESVRDHRTLHEVSCRRRARGTPIIDPPASPGPDRHQKTPV
jgi:hypothetical protein